MKAEGGEAWRCSRGVAVGGREGLQSSFILDYLLWIFF